MPHCLLHTVIHEALAKIIHKDNKLIPAMEYCVRELLRSESGERAAGLLKELEGIFQDPRELLTDYETAGKQLPATGIVPIDILLAYMLQKAAGQAIDFEFTLLGDPKPVTDRIPNEDLRTLLADLLENALIAASDGQVKRCF